MQDATTDRGGLDGSGTCYHARAAGTMLGRAERELLTAQAVAEGEGEQLDVRSAISLELLMAVCAD